MWGGSDSEAVKIKKSVADALAADELVISLAAALKQAQSDATAIITRRAPPPPPQPDPVPKGRKVLKRGSQQGLSVGEAKTLMSEIQSELREGMTVDISYSIVGEDDI